MRKLLPIDELNQLKETLRSRKLKNREVHDAVLSLLVMAYVNGTIDACGDLGIFHSIEVNDMYEAVYKKVAGKTFIQRIDKYLEEDDVEKIIRVADTDMQRVYNTAVYDIGYAEGAQFKQWVTMSDERVRDTHSYLEGATVGIDDEFYTFDGDHALFPGGFEFAENNVNCRCVIKLKNEKE